MAQEVGSPPPTWEIWIIPTFVLLSRPAPAGREHALSLSVSLPSALPRALQRNKKLQKMNTKKCKHISAILLRTKFPLTVFGCCLKSMGLPGQGEKKKSHSWAMSQASTQSSSMEQRHLSSLATAKRGPMHLQVFPQKLFSPTGKRRHIPQNRLPHRMQRPRGCEQM